MSWERVLVVKPGSRRVLAVYAVDDEALARTAAVHFAVLEQLEVDSEVDRD